MHDIELFMITKHNRPNDLMEWVGHHLSLGFDKIIIMDNNSSFSVKNLLNSVEQVEIREFNGHCRPWEQNASVAKEIFRNICYERKKFTRWLAVIDDDEYIYPKKSKNIKDYLDKNYPVLCMFWKMISSPKVLEDRPDTLVKTFTYVSPNATPWDNRIFIKSIINMNSFNSIDWLDPHMVLIDGKGVAYTYEGEFIPTPYLILHDNFYKNRDSLILYHFYHQSYADRVYKVIRCCKNEHYRSINKKVFNMEVEGKYTEFDNSLRKLIYGY